jgi:hypothetical protein
MSVIDCNKEQTEKILKNVFLKRAKNSRSFAKR